MEKGTGWSRDEIKRRGAEGISFVPRPSAPPVFDCLWYAKTEGEGLGNCTT